MTLTLKPENIDFDASQNEKRDKSLKNWRIVGITGWATVGLACIAIFVLFAFFLKPIPVIVKVDRLTGAVETEVGFTPPKPGSKEAEALARSHLIEYVRCRAGFSRGEAQICYQRVGFQSAGSLKGEWNNFYNPEKNPNAPLKIYGAADQIRIVKPSVSFFPTNKDGDVVANVRFDKETRLTTSEYTTKRMIATITYRYDPAAAPSKTEESWLNPLGFSVLNYRVDAETGDMPIANKVAAE